MTTPLTDAEIDSVQSKLSQLLIPLDGTKQLIEQAREANRLRGQVEMLRAALEPILGTFAPITGRHRYLFEQGEKALSATAPEDAGAIGDPQ